MGLQNQITDVSTESLPILVLLLIANGVSYLRYLLFATLHSIGLSQFHQAAVAVAVAVADEDLVVSGSGFLVLPEQLNLNNIFSYSYNINSRMDREVGGGGGAYCVVCLNRLRNGDCVRRLVCRHVFHKHCFDGWLDHLNFNCPLCRSPVVSGERYGSSHH